MAFPHGTRDQLPLLETNANIIPVRELQSVIETPTQEDIINMPVATRGKLHRLLHHITDSLQTCTSKLYIRVYSSHQHPLPYQRVQQPQQPRQSQ